MLEKIAIAIIVAFCAVAFYGIYVQLEECADRGGVLVRSVFSHECVKR